MVCLARDLPEAKYLRDLAVQCHRLAQRSCEPDMSAELTEIADALIAKADKMDREVRPQPQCAD